MFEELGIDYCCGGKSLLFACREKNLNPQIVLTLIQGLTSATDPLDQVNP
jgi:iron-sulfur cluster repair protein YtfE (RIC family)